MERLQGSGSCKAFPKLSRKFRGPCGFCGSWWIQERLQGPVTLVCSFVSTAPGSRGFRLTIESKTALHPQALTLSCVRIMESWVVSVLCLWICRTLGGKDPAHAPLALQGHLGRISLQPSREAPGNDWGAREVQAWGKQPESIGARGDSG